MLKKRQFWSLKLPSVFQGNLLIKF
ncbi:hypothetical protein Nmel_003756 [Mimus melanotis]